MKKYLRVLPLMMLAGCALVSCGSQDETSDTSAATVSTTVVSTSEESTATEVTNIVSSYKATFVTDSHVKVYVYKTADYTTEPELAETAVSRNSETGEETTADGQVNFLLVFEDGYELDAITATEGTYSNIKTPTDTKKVNVYRITKITADTTVTITSKESTGEEVTSYKATFVTDNHVKVYVYTTADYTTTPVEATEALSRDDDGNETIAGGQINFLLEFEDGYELDSLTVTDGTYKNIKYPAELGTENVYRVTKITADTTVTITSKESTGEVVTSYKATFVTDGHVKVSVYNTTSYDTETPVEATEALTRDTSGNETLTDGQVNFLLTFDEGYELDSLTVTAGTYKNIKTPTDTLKDNVYRVTKITANTTITITCKAITA